jgi:hypothetical protein
MASTLSNARCYLASPVPTEILFQFKFMEHDWFFFLARLTASSHWTRWAYWWPITVFVLFLSVFIFHPKIILSPYFCNGSMIQCYFVDFFKTRVCFADRLISNSDIKLLITVWFDYWLVFMQLNDTVCNNDLDSVSYVLLPVGSIQSYLLYIFWYFIYCYESPWITQLQ